MAGPQSLEDALLLRVFCGAQWIVHGARQHQLGGQTRRAGRLVGAKRERAVIALDHHVIDLEESPPASPRGSAGLGGNAVGRDQSERETRQHRAPSSGAGALPVARARRGLRGGLFRLGLSRLALSRSAGSGSTGSRLFLLRLLLVGRAPVVGAIEAGAPKQDARASRRDPPRPALALRAAPRFLVLDSMKQLEPMSALATTVGVRGHVFFRFPSSTPCGCVAVPRSTPPWRSRMIREGTDRRRTPLPERSPPRRAPGDARRDRSSLGFSFPTARARNGGRSRRTRRTRRPAAPGGRRAGW